MRRSRGRNAPGILLVVAALAVLGAALAWSTIRPASPLVWSLTATYAFSGSKPDADWAVYDSASTGNQDLRDPSLVQVSDSVLQVKAEGPAASGLCLCGSQSKPRTPYGRWDVRARVSANPDHGCAILLWPNAENWPEGGEIDIAEYPDANRRHVQFTVHYGKNNSHIRSDFAGDFTQWHTYRVDWTPDAISYYIDDHLLVTVAQARAIPTAPMHLALQAGPDVAHPSDTSATLQVQWVKTYRRKPGLG